MVALSGQRVSQSLAWSPVYMGRFKAPCRRWSEVGVLRKDGSLPLKGEMTLKSFNSGNECLIADSIQKPVMIWYLQWGQSLKSPKPGYRESTITAPPGITSTLKECVVLSL